MLEPITPVPIQPIRVFPDTICGTAIASLSAVKLSTNLDIVRRLYQESPEYIEDAAYFHDEAVSGGIPTRLMDPL